jgi:hypothetical protein
MPCHSARTPNSDKVKPSPTSDTEGWGVRKRGAFPEPSPLFVRVFPGPGEGREQHVFAEFIGCQASQREGAGQSSTLVKEGGIVEEAASVG